MDKLKEKEVLFIKSKNILIVCLVLVLIFGVGVSFAADTDQGDALHAINNDTAVSVSDTDAVSIIDDNKLSDGAGAFNDLNTLIKGTESGGTLTLTEDFEYNSETDSGLVINKPITIDGDGHTIKGNDIDYLIKVTGDNVVLKNLNFIDSGNGGTNLIYWTGDNGQIINSYFYNITSTVTIRFQGHNETISNSRFSNATPVTSTSCNIYNSDFKNMNIVLYLESGGGLNVYDCNFTNVHEVLYTVRATAYFENIRVLNSTADVYIDTSTKRTIISIKDYCTIRNSYFEGISGQAVLGGGILVYNSTFKSNDASYMVVSVSGGGSYTGITVDGCKFIDNKNYLFEPNYANFKVLNSEFENNNIINIPVTQHSFIMDNCTFKDNTASGDALIKFSGSSNKARVVNSKFINNNGFTTAPIYIIAGSFYSDNNTFTNNINSTNGLSSIVNTVGTTFTPIDVVYASPNGQGDGSINSRTNLTNALNLVSFGGTIYLEPGEYTDLTTRVNLNANIIGEDSGVIINNGSFVNYVYNGVIKNITFYDMQYPILFNVAYSNIFNCTFSNYNKSSTVVYIDGFTYAHGHKLTNITILNSKISQINNYYSKYNTLEYSFENISVIESSVSGNLIDFGSTGDSIIKNLKCIRSNFTGNLFYFRNPDYSQSYGHIISVDDLSLNDCIFESNILNSQNTWAPTKINNVVVVNCTTKSTLFNGVQCTYSDITVNDSNKDYSSDIFYMGTSDYSISDVTLSNLAVGSIISSTSQALSFDGLTVKDVSGSYGFIGISGSEFKNFNFNNVEFTKLGVLYDDSSLKDSSFTGYKGHIEISGDNIEISGSTFTNGANTGMNGGAIELVSGDNFVVNNCNFTSNKATNGGAVYINNVTDSSYIMDCNFTSNTATSNGGAIYIETGIYYYVSQNTRDTLGNNNPNNNLYKETGVLETKDVVWVTYTGTGDGEYNNPCAFADCLDYVSPYGTIMFKGVGLAYTYTSIVNRDYLKPGLKIYGNYSVVHNYHFNIESLATGVEIYNLILCDVTSDSVIIWEGDNGKIVNCTFKDNGGANVKYGAALKVTGDNLEIKNTVFENNIASNNDDGYSYGGAIYCNATGLNINNSTFSQNTVYGYGSHIYLDEYANDVCINASKFNQGKITGSNSLGSAVYVCSESDLVVCNNTFTSNNAVDGGALNIHRVIANVEIYNNTFTSNSASNNGGAIAFTCSAVSNLEIYNNTYTSNSAKNGGAIYSNVGFSESGSTFKSNSATDGSAIYLAAGNSLTLTNDKFESNTASSHGTVYIGEGGSVNPTDVTFTGNAKGNIYFAGNYIASELYVSSSGTSSNSGATTDDPTTLTNALQHISSGGKIIFLSDLTVDAIAITNKNIALVGNGWTITRSGTGRAFTITSSTVNIENLTFNGFTTADYVISYDSASSGSVVNTNFTNQASGTSALDIEGNVDVTNCLFEDNDVTVGALYYGSSASGTVSGSTFDNENSLYLDSDVTVSGNTFVCQDVSIDAITSPQSYHSTVTISGTFDDGTNRPHTINITSNGESINVASLTSTKTFSYSYVNLTNGDYSISMNVVDDGNTYTYTAPTRSFTVSPANTIYIGPSATGDGSGVDTSNLATWDTIGTRLASNGIVYFTNGEYSLNQKTISNPWTLTASSADNVLIDGGSNTIFTVNSAGVTIENLTLTSNTRPILGTSTVTVKNSVLYNQLTIDSFSDPVYGDTITISGSIGNIDIASLEAYSGDELIGSTTISGSATTYTITRNGNLAVGSYTLSATKKQEKRRIL